MRKPLAVSLFLAGTVSVLSARYAWADDILGQWNCALAALN